MRPTPHNRRVFVTAVVLTFVLAATAGPPLAADDAAKGKGKRPNIVLIMALLRRRDPHAQPR